MSFNKYCNVKLADICEIGSSKRIYASEYTKDGIPFYRSKEIIQKAKNEEITDTLFISREKYEELNKKFGSPKKGEILLSSIGANMGTPYYIDADEKFYFKDGNVTWFKNFSNSVDSKYIYYWLTSPETQVSLVNIAIGSAQPALTIDSLKKMKINLPSIEYQKFIVDILSSLDDKIKINNLVNQKLEEMARAIFKRWFVDFEFPNEEGEPYKSSGGKFAESELGMIPEGWEAKNLHDFVDSISKSINKKEKRIAIFLNTSDILEGQFLHEDYSNVNEMPGQAKKLIQKNDILYSEIRPANKRFAYVDFDAEDYVVSTKLMVLRTNEQIFSSKCLYLFLKSPQTLYELQQLAESRSGTFPQITFKELSKFKFALPDKEKFKTNYAILEDLINYQFNLIKENKSLMLLRDTLLPKLMSGEIRINEAKQEVETCLQKSN